ncbi:MAG: hypothetical protein FGM43_07930 [Sinobacteraceae bacterium]|nr:hypothetical protein [Nevskiaceae bacterium]
MNWLLVVVVLGTPIKTDMVFPSLADCLRTEETMRKVWAEHQLMAAKQGADSVHRDSLRKQMPTGTCIPVRRGL